MPTRDTRIAPTASEISTSVPTMLGWLASLTMGGALVAASMIVLPFWPIQHKPVDLGVAAVLLPVGLAMWFARKRAPGWAIHAGLLLGIGSTTASVWATGPTAASQLPALYYGFLIAFVGVFLRRRLALTYVALAGGLYLAALLTHWRAALATQWTMTMIAITLPCVVISTLVGRLRMQALHDALTGLPNRRRLEELLAVQVNIGRREGWPFSIAAIDLDGLKRINDEDGHAAGDQLLQATTRGWLNVLRSTDSLARIGGDEFVLVLPGSELDEAQAVVARLRAELPSVPFSAGIVSWSGHSIDELLRRADAGLYAAKKMGGGLTVSDPTADWNSTLDPDQQSSGHIAS
jgi:diguanylate cyclase (GGDEF)-like protein